MGEVAHAIRVRTTMPFLFLLENFSGFQLQEEHNASTLFQYVANGISPSCRKCTKLIFN